MKTLLLAASAASLLALAGPAMAQSGNTYDGPMHYAPDNGPQMRYMEENGSTVLDRAPYSRSDAYSDQLSNHRIYWNRGQ